ncbi:MAG: peptide chain release factor 2 [Desulfobacterales bacterium]|nr:peptide chain release factor 2 [Desulfobacterales bacterium]
MVIDWNNLGVIFDLDGKAKRLKEIEGIISKEGFWDTPEETKDLLRERTTLAETIDSWQKLHHELEDTGVLLGLAIEENDEASTQEVAEALQRLEDAVNRMALARMLSGKDDDKNAIVSINAGAGGTEAQDWAEMLFRMYMRWAERKNYKTTIVDFQPGEEAGIKGATFISSGPYAYGYLKGETGIHRLVRMSPFDASNRRHTSFASVSVSPELNEDVVIEVDEKDLRVDTYRSSGAGGQHVNKTSSAIRITHLPTGIVVQSQQESSQHRNKAIAMKILKSRLYELEQSKRAEEKQALYESKSEIAWGSQIRSYTLHPYQMVKDHRIDLGVGNVNDVLDGNLDPFIEGVLLARN